jgi:hypothetical protein
LADLVDFRGHQILLQVTFGVLNTLSPMKNLKLLAAITVACSALISGLQAAPITYSIVDNAAYQDGYTISGSITTDGTLGDITESGITSWNWTITDTATSAVVVSASGDGASGNNFVRASATQIYLNPLGSTYGGTSNLRLAGSSATLQWDRREASGFDIFQRPAMDQYYGHRDGSGFLWYRDSSGESLPLSSTADGSWIIAEVSTVPEPSTYGLLFGGFTLAVVAMRRRTSKQA